MTRKGGRRKTALFLLDISQGNATSRSGMLALFNDQFTIDKNILDACCELMRIFINGLVLNS